MPTIFLRQMLAMIVIVVLASCGTGEPRRPPELDPEGVPASQFQQRLDALGIPLALPRGRAILVNIPSYELVALEDGTPVFWSRVIIGTPETRTPRIDTATNSVVFLPSWRPTPEMVASGEVPDRVFPPGPGNPMGLMAVTLETRLDIALHDTNQRYLFERDERAFSHGCIRVQKWEALAAWLLDRDEAWVQEKSAGSVTQRFSTPRVPVLIRYFTVFPSEDGSVRGHPDIYGLGSGRTAFMAFREFPASSDAAPRSDRACRIVE